MLVVSLTLLVGALLLYPVGILAGRDVADGVRGVLRAGAGGGVRVALVARGAAGDGRERASARRCRRSSRGFILPLAASVFRVGAAVAMPVGVLFLARLYGVAALARAARVDRRSP